MPTIDNYHEATRLLTSGRNFVRAAQHLEGAVRREPNNSAYRLALGCAYASRAASLAHARTANWNRLNDLRFYPQQLKDWEETRKAARAEGTAFAQPRPVAPPATPFPTKDDSQPLALPGSALNKEFERLTRAAFAAWQEGARRAVTPSQKAEAEYVRGWGILLLDAHRHAAQMSDVPQDIDLTAEETTPPAPVAPWIPEQKDAVTAFARATKFDPRQPRYWQSLGDAQEMDYETPEEPRSPAAHSSYLRSLRLAPRNARLWYKIGMQERPTEYSGGQMDAARRKRALDYLTHAAQAAPTAPDPLQLSAYIHFFGTPYGTIQNSIRRPQPDDGQSLAALTRQARQKPNRDAARAGLAALEQANRRPNPARALSYQAPVPPQLAAAWEYRAGTSILMRSGDMNALRELARAVSGYARFLTMEGDTAQARRAADAVVKLGERLIGNWPVRNRTPASSEALDAAIGVAVAQVGHDTRVAILQQYGTAQEARQAAENREAFQKRLQAWQQAYQQASAIDY